MNKINISKALLCMLLISSTTLTSCASYHGSDFSDISPALKEIEAHKDTNRFDELVSSVDGEILLFGWGYENAQKCNFDISNLTDSEKQLYIQKGIQIVTQKAENEEPLTVEDNNQLVTFFWESMLARYYHAKDMKKCLYWASLGAEKGCHDCMCLLSSCYRRGDGVVQDLVEGIKWMYLSASLGNEFCKKWLDENGYPFMFDKDISYILEDGRKLANQWMNKHRKFFISKS